MKRRHLVTFIVAAGTLSLPGLALAQGQETPGLVSVFDWLLVEEPANWGMGAVYAVLGACGALVTVFTLIGGAFPGTAGHSRIAKAQILVEEREAKVNELLTAQTPDSAAISAIAEAANKLRDDTRRDRWVQFGVGAFVYVLLGAVFASALAQDLLQALVLGAGWTGAVGALGIRTDYAERNAAKSDSLGQLVSKLEGFVAANKIQMTPDLSEALDNARVLKRL